jgi:hypothetical protein
VYPGTSLPDPAFAQRHFEGIKAHGLFICAFVSSKKKSPKTHCSPGFDCHDD